jgi:hypothetical protein
MELLLTNDYLNDGREKINHAFSAQTNVWSASTGTDSVVRHNLTGNEAIGTNSLVLGINNKAYSEGSHILGGLNNIIYTNSFISTIVAGSANTVSQACSLVLGGTGNTMNGQRSIIGTGMQHLITGADSLIAAGSANTISATRAFVGSGIKNTVSGYDSAIITGTLNTQGGYYSLIGAGNGNKISGSSSLTNIIGAGINNTLNGTDDYFGMNISSGILTGVYNLISGGIGAGIVAGSANTTSSAYSIIGGGIANKMKSTPGSGFLPIPSYVPNSFIGAGSANTIVTNTAFIVGGTGNRATGENSFIGAGEYAYTWGKGQMANASGMFAAVGDAQVSNFVLRNKTTNATATELFTDSISQRILFPSGNRVWGFSIKVVAMEVTSSGPTSIVGTAMYREVKGTAKVINGLTALVGSTTSTTIAQDTNAATWAVAVTAVSGSLRVTVTGAASKSIRWVANVELTEVGHMITPSSPPPPVDPDISSL